MSNTAVSLNRNFGACLSKDKLVRMLLFTLSSSDALKAIATITLGLTLKPGIRAPPP
jgi:hypothetical protein